MRYENADTLTDPTLAVLAANGYIESERDAYAHWKDISYTNGDTTFTFNYSRRAGNLKAVYVYSEKDLWGCNVDLTRDAMYFNSYIAKHLPGKTFIEKLHSLIANPVPYCLAADHDRSVAMRAAADALDRAYSC